MATNPDFLKIVVKDVTLQWPRLDQPYRYDPAKEETVACAAGAPNAGYSVSWKCSLAEGRELFERVKAHYKECQARDPKMPPFARVFGMKKDEAAGEVTFTAKKRAMNNDGKVNDAPAVVDIMLKPLEDPRIWSGSKGGLKVFAFPATDPQTKEGGISFSLNAVVVTEPQYGSDSLEDDFGDMKTKTPAGFDDFDAPKQQQPTTQRPAPAAGVMSDDVPF
jgi:hypothetical protein